MRPVLAGGCVFVFLVLAGCSRQSNSSSTPTRSYSHVADEVRIERVGGTRISYDEDGNIVAVWAVKIADGKPVLDEDGNEILHGVSLRWTKLRHLDLYAEYSDGELHGVLRRYYLDSGEPKVEMNYVHGNLTGATVKWWPNGKVRATGAYLDGNAVGDWKFFDREGNPVSRDSED